MPLIDVSLAMNDLVLGAGERADIEGARVHRRREPPERLDLDAGQPGRFLCRVRHGHKRRRGERQHRSAEASPNGAGARDRELLAEDDAR
jgi:hypothetical protein